MPVLITCGTCGKRLRVGDDLAGTQVKCPLCGLAVPVPLQRAQPMDGGRGAPPPALFGDQEMPAVPANPGPILYTRVSRPHRWALLVAVGATLAVVGLLVILFTAAIGGPAGSPARPRAGVQSPSPPEAEEKASGGALVRRLVAEAPDGGAPNPLVGADFGPFEEKHAQTIRLIAEAMLKNVVEGAPAGIAAVSHGTRLRALVMGTRYEAVAAEHIKVNVGLDGRVSAGNWLIITTSEWALPGRLSVPANTYLACRGGAVAIATWPE